MHSNLSFSTFSLKSPIFTLEKLNEDQKARLFSDFEEEMRYKDNLPRKLAIQQWIDKTRYKLSLDSVKAVLNARLQVKILLTSQVVAF